MVKDKTIYDYFSVKYFAGMSLLISTLMQIAIFLSFYFDSSELLRPISGGERPPFHLDGFVTDVLFNFIIAFSLYMYCICIYQKDIKDVAKLFYAMIGIVIITIVLSIIFTPLHPIVLNLLHDNAPPVIIDDCSLYVNRLIHDFFTAIIVALSWELTYLSYKRQMMAIENERLIKENHVAKYEALKNQINPHFLFNSLNTLQSLIISDQAKAENYVQEMSKVLRYTLQCSDVVTLEEEMQIVNSYCTLVQLRYGSNLRFDFDIDERLMRCKLIPLSLQTLIENAIKHNVISDKNPLVIKIFSDFKKREIVVCNKIQPKIESSAGGGIGLVNLSERYKLKWNRDIEIYNDGTDFRVVINVVDIDIN